VISRLQGVLEEKEPTRLVLDCRGIGFELRVPLSTSRALPETGAEVQVLVEPYFTRDGLDLYGFGTRAERDIFRLLTSVKGIGPKAGLNLLSRFTPEEIRQFISQGRSDVLRTVPGLGPKKVDNIIRQLEGAAPALPADSPLLVDAASALQNLGLTRKEARDRLARVQVADSMTLQDLLRLALAQRD
jgi:Holliday junction DNA helicase RuvA